MINIKYKLNFNENPIIKKEVLIITEIKTQSFLRAGKILLIVGGILAIIALLTPACNSTAYGVDIYMWFAGFWVAWIDHPYYGTETDSGGPRDFFYLSADADKYIGLASAVVIMLIIATIMMFISSKTAKEGRDNKVAIATGAIGTVLAFLGPGVYYGYLDREFSWWVAFDQGIGFYLPIIAGVLGIIATSFNIYAFTLEPKVGEERVIEQYQPPTDKQVAVQVQQEGLKFCPNCGAKLTGPFCQECGTKVS